MSKSLQEAAKELLSSIEEMFDHDKDKEPFYGPFSEWDTVEDRTVQGWQLVRISWPNLKICADELRRALNRVEVDAPDYAHPLTDDGPLVIPGTASGKLERDSQQQHSTIKAERACECSTCDKLILYGEDVYLDANMKDEVFCSELCRARASYPEPEEGC